MIRQTYRRLKFLCYGSSVFDLLIRLYSGRGNEASELFHIKICGVRQYKASFTYPYVTGNPYRCVGPVRRVARERGKPKTQENDHVNPARPPMANTRIFR